MVDILLIAPDLNERRNILAELVEAGYRVLAVDSWPPRLWPRPRAVIVDLHNLTDARAVLEDLRLLVPPGRVVAVAGALPPDAGDVRRLGPFRVLARPITVGAVVNEIRRALASPDEPSMPAPVDPPGRPPPGR